MAKFVLSSSFKWTQCVPILLLHILVGFGFIGILTKFFVDGTLVYGEGVTPSMVIGLTTNWTTLYISDGDLILLSAGATLVGLLQILIGVQMIYAVVKDEYEYLGIWIHSMVLTFVITSGIHTFVFIEDETLRALIFLSAVINFLVLFGSVVTCYDLYKFNMKVLARVNAKFNKIECNNNSEKSAVTIVGNQKV